MFRVTPTAFMLAAVVVAGVFAPMPAQAEVMLRFVGHARFEAAHARAGIAADPEVFVADENAPQATGPLGIVRAAGYRPALLGDNQGLPLFNAQGDGLSLSLARWLGGGGTAEFAAADGDDARVVFTFTGLIPFGVYSIFISRSTPDGTVVSPFSESTNTLSPSIDGFLTCSAVSSMPLETGDTLLLVYHSDGVAHGQNRGNLGVDAHDQLLLSVVLPDHRDPADSTAVPMPTDPRVPSPPVEQPPADSAAPTVPTGPTGDVYAPTERAAQTTAPQPTESVTGDGEPKF